MLTVTNEKLKIQKYNWLSYWVYCFNWPALFSYYWLFFKEFWSSSLFQLETRFRDNQAACSGSSSIIYIIIMSTYFCTFKKLKQFWSRVSKYLPSTLVVIYLLLLLLHNENEKKRLRESGSYKYSNKPMIWKFQACCLFLIGIRFTWSLCEHDFHIVTNILKAKIGIFKTWFVISNWALISPRASLQFSTTCFLNVM